MLVCIYLFCGNHETFFFFQNSFIKKRSKEQHFFEMETFNNTMNVFTVAFDKFDALHYIRILFWGGSMYGCMVNLLIRTAFNSLIVTTADLWGKCGNPDCWIMWLNYKAWLECSLNAVVKFKGSTYLVRMNSGCRRPLIYDVVGGVRDLHNLTAGKFAEVVLVMCLIMAGSVFSWEGWSLQGLSWLCVRKMYEL